MGYYVKIVKSTCVIPNENKEEVLQIWKDLNKPENNHLKNGGSWKSGEQTAWWYSWMDADYDQTCHSVDDVLDQLGFDYGLSDNGDVAIGGYDSKSGQEDVFFEAVEHLLVGDIEWMGEQGEEWTIRYGKQAHTMFHDPWC